MVCRRQSIAHFDNTTSWTSHEGGIVVCREGLCDECFYFWMTVCYRPLWRAWSWRVECSLLGNSDKQSRLDQRVLHVVFLKFTLDCTILETVCFERQGLRSFVVGVSSAALALRGSSCLHFPNKSGSLVGLGFVSRSLCITLAWLSLGGSLARHWRRRSSWSGGFAATSLQSSWRPHARRGTPS